MESSGLKNKKVLISGASSGIGKSMAISLAQRGCSLFLVARREDKLIEVKNEISRLYPKTKIDLISKDVNDPTLAETLSQITQEQVDIFINNAGLALGREKVELSQWDDMEQMIKTNVVANFKLAHLVIPWMLKKGEGDLINLCSVAGHYTYAGGAIYCATKHAVQAFTRVLREETCGRNIRIMQISPGMVNTDFSTVRFKGDRILADKIYEGMEPLLAEDISRMMMFMLDQPRHVVIDEIITMPMAQGAPTTVIRSKV